MENLVGMPLLCGVIFIAAGLVMYIFPPKKINNFYGYRTSSSMSSIEKWHFSQRYSSLRMIESGAFLMLFSALGFLVTLSENAELALGITTTLLAVFYMLFRTENALKNRFPNP